MQANKKILLVLINLSLILSVGCKQFEIAAPSSDNVGTEKKLPDQTKAPEAPRRPTEVSLPEVAVGPEEVHLPDSVSDVAVDVIEQLFTGGDGILNKPECLAQSETPYSFDALYPCASVEGTYLGISMAASNERVFAATMLGSEQTNALSSVYVFEKSNEGYLQSARITAKDQAPLDMFGRKIAAHGNTLVVASIKPARYAENGKVYIFELSGGRWHERQVLTRPSFVTGRLVNPDQFGAALALSEDTLLVGAPSVDAVIEYRKNKDGWAYHTTHRSAHSSAVGTKDGLPGFGHNLSLRADKFLVTTFNGVSHGRRTGTVHVFERQAGNFAEVALLQPKAEHEVGGFGSSLSLDGDLVAVGAPDSGNRPGSVYLYRAQDGSEYKLSQYLQAHDKLVAYQNPYGGEVIYRRTGFGYHVHVQGDSLLVYSMSQNYMYDIRNSGAFYVYKENSDGAMEISNQILNDDHESGHANSLLVLEDKILAGVASHNAHGPQAGRVHILPNFIK